MYWKAAKCIVYVYSYGEFWKGKELTLNCELDMSTITESIISLLLHDNELPADTEIASTWYLVLLRRLSIRSVASKKVYIADNGWLVYSPSMLIITSSHVGCSEVMTSSVLNLCTWNVV